MQFCKTIAAITVALLSVTANLYSQAASKPFYWNSDFTVPPGHYMGGAETVTLIGGAMGSGFVRLSKNPVTGKLQPNTCLTGVTIFVSHGKLEARGVAFNKCSFIVSQRGSVDFEGCVINNSTLALSAVVPKMLPDPNIDQVIRGSTTLRNCVMKNFRMNYEGGTPVSNMYEIVNCTWLGDQALEPTAASPNFPPGTPGLLDELRRSGSKVQGCTFSNTLVFDTFFAMTENCRFTDCVFKDANRPALADQKIPIFAILQPEDSLHTASGFSCFAVTGEGVNPPGSAMQYDLKSGDAVVSSITYPEASSDFVKALPPTVPGSALPVVARGITGTDGAPDTGLKLQQASVHGLLIMSLGNGEAGSASKMSAIALDGDKSRQASVSFNQLVGEMMHRALAEVGKFTQLRNKGWPKGYRIELSFADKYSDKDGPSAAVACALLLNSLITGQENDPSFAVTGDMNADGSVQPIGGVGAKIRGATNGKCKVVAIPSKNESALGDLLLTDGPAPFAGIQIYSVESFDEALALALKDKPAATQNAINEMARVQEVLMRDKSQLGAWLRNQHVVSKLQAVYQAAPNNLSAKYLLMYAAGKVPTTLSLAGSLDALENSASDLIASIKANKGQNANALRKDVVGTSITKLQNLRARCDARLRPYADAIIRFGVAVKEAQDRPATSGARASVLINTINGAAETAENEINRLMSDPQVIEELER